MQVEKLGTFEKEELLRWFLYKLSLEDRGELMRTYPQHYNKLLGKPLVLTKFAAETVGKGTSVSCNGKTYKPGDIVPEHEV